MSFGSPHADRGGRQRPDFADNRAYAEKVARATRAHPDLCATCNYVQSLDYPTVDVDVDREQAGLSGVTADEVARSLVAATSSSRFVVPNYWRDPEDRHRLSGAGGDPAGTHELGSAKSSMVPVKQTPHRPTARCATWPRSSEGTMPGEFDRYNMRRVVSMTANIEGEDLGRVADQHRRGAARRRRAAARRRRSMCAARSCRCSRCSAAWRWAWRWRWSSIFLLLTAYFQSLRLALVAVSTVPAVLAGVVLALLADRHDAEHPVVHGGDHGHRRGGGQRHPAGHLRRAGAARAAAARRRRRVEGGADAGCGPS